MSVKLRLIAARLLMTPLGQLEKFFRLFPRTFYKSGTILLSPGQLPSGLYFLRSGLVSEYGVSRTGSTTLIHLYKPGSLIPLIHSLNALPVSHFFQTFTDSVVYKAPPERVVKFLMDHPEVQYHLLLRLLRTMGNLSNRTEVLTMGNAYTRTAWVLSFLAKNFGRTQSGRICIPFRFTQKDISDWIGISRETASIQLNRLQKKGLVTASRRLLFISDLKRLEAEHCL